MPASTGADGAELGTSLAPDVEGLVLADIDLGLISLAKAAADPVGHDARPDVTRLLLNKTPGDRVVQWSPSQGLRSEAGAVAWPEPAEATEAAEPMVRHDCQGAFPGPSSTPIPTRLSGPRVANKAHNLPK